LAFRGVAKLAGADSINDTVNFAAQGLAALMFIPALFDGFVKTIQQISDSEINLNRSINHIAGYVVLPESFERLSQYE
jgi:hypothetical protein